jgi:hypothetical protein
MGSKNKGRRFEVDQGQAFAAPVTSGKTWPGKPIIRSTESTMQEIVKTTQTSSARLPNPLLDLTVAGLEAQLKAWQAFQVEGAHFIAKRLRANLELLRAFGHCTEAGHVGECHRAWLSELQGDYAEEWGRVVATTASLVFADLGGMGFLFGPCTTKLWPNVAPGPAVQPRQNAEERLHVAA